MYVTCDKHVDNGIDEFVDQFATSPDLYRLEKVQFTDWTAPTQCHFCSLPPVYLLT